MNTTKSDSFRIGPIRPPSEANSLLLQVTNGCTWNRCKFCTVYRDTKFKAFSADSVKADIDAIAKIAEEVGAFWHAEMPGLMEKVQTGNAGVGNTGADTGSGNSAGPGSWDLEGLNQKLSSIADDEARQSFYTVANWLVSGGENVFLQDGNTTALASGRLTDVLVYLKQTFPRIRRITSYGRAADLSRHGADYFAELKEAGLDRIHSGFESGSDEVLALINKGCTAAQEIAAGKAIKAGGIELSVYFMPGVGGLGLTKENAEGTARVINEVNPDFLRVRTAAVKPGTDLYRDFSEGRYCLCGDDEKVEEIRRVIELAEGVGTVIVSDHMVNLLQDIEGPVCKDLAKADRLCPDLAKADLLRRIDRYLNLPEAERRVFQLLRRTLRAYDLDDMANLTEGELSRLREAVRQETKEAWDEKMNGYICRYI